MRRFTDTEKWKDVWFRGLKPPEKLVFLFVVDNCNNAGFYETDLGMMEFQTGVKEAALQGALKGLERGLKEASGWYWVRRFLRHQKNDQLNPENPAHKQIISQIEDQLERFSEVPEFQEFIAPFKGLFCPIGKGIGKGKKEESPRETSKRKATIEELRAFCSTLSLPGSDAEWLFDKWEGTGWKNDGKPIVDWRATVRTWKRAGILLSQKSNGSSLKAQHMPTIEEAMNGSR